MSSIRRSKVLHEITIDTDKASISICGTPDLEDEIEILANSEYDGCHIDCDQVTFYSLKKPKSIGSKTNKTFVTRKSPKNPVTSQKIQSKTLPTTDTKVDINVQDIVWARHTPNLPFWPAYVKRTTSNFVFLFYISRTSFSAKVAPYKKGKNEVVVFSATTVNRIMKQGLDYYKKRDLWNYFSDLHNAISLAKTYLALKKRHYFSAEESIFNFFNSDVPISELGDLLSPPTTSKKTHRQTLKIAPKKRLCFSDDKVVKRRKIVAKSELYQASTSKNISEKRDRISLNHNNLSQRVLDFILQGRCKSHIEQVLKHHFPSSRMRVFQEGTLTSLERKDWELDNVHPYFLREDQQDAVMHYLRELLLERQKKNRERMAITKFIRLLFDVLYPETIIWAISKVSRIPYDAAEMVYKERKLPDLSGDSFVLNLSATDKEKIRQGVQATFEKLGIGNETL